MCGEGEVRNTIVSVFVQLTENPNVLDFLFYLHKQIGAGTPAAAYIGDNELHIKLMFLALV